MSDDEGDNYDYDEPEPDDLNEDGNYDENDDESDNEIKIKKIFDDDEIVPTDKPHEEPRDGDDGDEELHNDDDEPRDDEEPREDIVELVMTGVENASKKFQQEQHSRPILSKYERAKIIGVRAEQISRGMPVMFDYHGENLIDAIDIAKRELELKLTPFKIKRNYIDGRYEIIDIADLIDFGNLNMSKGILYKNIETELEKRRE